MSGGLSNGQSQVDGILNHNAADNGVPVHKFDPDASPEEKAAQAGKARDKLASVVNPQESKERGKFSLFFPHARGSCQQLLKNKYSDNNLAFGPNISAQR